MSGEISQLACPFCGRNRPLNRGFSLGEMTIPPDQYGVITVRAVGPGPGRGHKGEREEGFRTIDRLNIIEALEDPQFADIAVQVRDRLITIIRIYIESGVISMKKSRRVEIRGEIAGISRVFCGVTRKMMGVSWVGWVFHG